MDMWQALQYVGTGLSLVGFIVAALLMGYRARLTQRARVIRSAPEKERLEAIATTAEFFRVDVSGLTRAQQQEIALTQIHARARRDLLLAGLSFAVALLLAIVALAAIWAPKSAGVAHVVTQSGTVIAPGRDLIGSVNVGLDEKQVAQRIAEAQKPLTERFEKLAIEIAREKGVPAATLKAILARLGEVNVPDNQIIERLSAQADAYLALKEQWKQVGSTNFDLAAVRQKALLLMDTQGDLLGAKALLEDARKQLKDKREASLLTEATLIGDEARIESLRYNYLEAAQLYDTAARLVMFDLRASLSWRLKEAGAFLRQGDEFADSAALRVAINGYRAILVVAPQALGAEANAMVEKELCKALRILSDRENDTQGMDDLAEAILMCEEALKVLTAERHPVDWAVTKSSLAIAVMSLGRRTGANEPLKHAEAMFRELLVLDVQSSSDRSKTKGNLASVLRLLGNVEHDSKRLDEATHLFRQALTEISLDRDPMTWSAVQNNLGATYRLWGQMESSVSLLRQAEESYKQALSVISRERAPYQWAQITDNMALVLLLLGRCTSSRETLQNALALADSALEIFHKADSKPDIDLAEGRRASIQRELNDLPSKTNCAA